MKIIFITLTILLASTIAEGETSPYAGQQSRDIKALSDSQIKGYIAGRGMGMARAAELNNYPGPRHVLVLSAHLEQKKILNEEQVMKYNELRGYGKNSSHHLNNSHNEH